MVVPQTGPPSCIAACALVFTMTAVVIRALVRGASQGCHCFGYLSKKHSIGYGTVIRNAILGGLGILGVIKYRPVESIGSLAGGTTPTVTVILLTATVTVLLVSGHHFLRRFLQGHASDVGMLSSLSLDIARFAHRRDGGNPEPFGHRPSNNSHSFILHTLTGETTTLSEVVGTTEKVLLIFLTPACASCVYVSRQLLSSRPSRTSWKVIAVNVGTSEEVYDAFPTLDPHDILIDRRAVSAFFGVAMTPAALVIDHGTTSSHAVSGASAVLELFSFVTDSEEFLARPARNRTHSARLGIVGRDAPQMDAPLRLLCNTHSRRSALATLGKGLVAVAIGSFLTMPAAEGEVDAETLGSVTNRGSNGNGFHGNCKAFNAYAVSHGVNSSNGSPNPGDWGVTQWSATVTPTPGNFKMKQSSGWQCPCHSAVYPTEAACDQACGQGLGGCLIKCAGPIGVCLQTPPIKMAVKVQTDVSELQWVPSVPAASLSASCTQDLARLYAAIDAHEQHHVDDINDLAKTLQADNGKSYIACAPDAATAKADIEAQIEQDRDQLESQLKNMYQAAFNVFHHTPAGGPIPPLDCNLCP